MLILTGKVLQITSSCKRKGPIPFGERQSMPLLCIQMPEVMPLLMSSETYDWVGLTVDAYRTASFWFLQMCQPLWVLAQRSSLPALGFR